MSAIVKYSPDIERLKVLLPELSDRESQVSILYFTGLPIKEISDCLSISERTANCHICNSKNKFGLSTYQDLKTLILLRFLTAHHK